MTTRSGGPLARSQYHRLLRNPIYFGLIRYCGELHDGTHEPLITKSLFDRVQEVISGKRKPRQKKPVKPYLYRRAFHCAVCGGVITLETQKGHVYLRCTKKKRSCSEPYVREEVVSDQVTQALKRISVPEEWTAEMLAALMGEEQQEHESATAGDRSAAAQAAAIDQKLDRLTTAYLEEVLAVDEYRTARHHLLIQKTQLKEQGARARANP